MKLCASEEGALGCSYNNIFIFLELTYQTHVIFNDISPHGFTKRHQMLLKGRISQTSSLYLMANRTMRAANKSIKHIGKAEIRGSDGVHFFHLQLFKD